MSDEPIETDQHETDPQPANGGWKMPEPIFRSSEGVTPKTIANQGFGNEDVTEVPTAELEDISTVRTEATDEFAQAITEEIPVETPAPEPSKKGGCFQSVLLMLGMLGLFSAVIIAALVYFLFYFRPTETGTF
ncbi:hypothetical protein BH10ACI2_BH10ACI2_02780 [soil metagenome]